MYIAEKGFSGIISAHKGQKIEIKDNKIIKDLLKSGYIKEYTDKNEDQTELLENNSVLKQENDDLKENLETVTKENSDFKSQIEVLTKENKDNKSNIESFKNENESLKVELEKIKKENVEKTESKK